MVKSTYLFVLSKCGVWQTSGIEAEEEEKLIQDCGRRELEQRHDASLRGKACRGQGINRRTIDNIAVVGFQSFCHH